MSVNRVGTSDDGASAKHELFESFGRKAADDSKFDSITSLDTLNGPAAAAATNSAPIAVPTHTAPVASGALSHAAAAGASSLVPASSLASSHAQASMIAGAQSVPVSAMRKGVVVPAGSAVVRQFSIPVVPSPFDSNDHDDGWMAVPPLPSNHEPVLTADGIHHHNHTSHTPLLSSDHHLNPNLSSPLFVPDRAGGPVDPHTPSADSTPLITGTGADSAAAASGTDANGTPKKHIGRSRAASLNLAVKHSETKSNLMGAATNLFNDVLSAGFVGMPAFFSQSGIVLGPIVMLIYGLLSFGTLMLERELLERHHLSSFAEMCYRAFGRNGYIVANILMFIFNWGSFLVPMILLGTVLPTLLRGWFGDYAGFDRHIVLFVTLLVFSPLAFYKSIGKFAKVTFLAQVALFSIFLLVTGTFFSDHAYGDNVCRGEPYPEHTFAAAQPTFLQALGGISYLYTCQDMFCHIYHSLDRPTPKRIAVVTCTVCLGFFTVGTTVGVFGYLLYCQNTAANVLDNFPADTLTQLCRFMLLIAVGVSVPYNVFMPRVSIMSLVQIRYPELVIKGAGPREARHRLHIIVTIAILLATLLIIELVTNLGAVFSFVGGVSAIGISLILPPLCYLKLEWTRASNLRKGLCFFCIISGVVGSLGAISSLFS